ncbi:ABC transporter G family member 35-like protein [Tanacetum coccineum]
MPARDRLSSSLIYNLSSSTVLYSCFYYSRTARASLRDLSRLHSRPQPRPGSKEETFFNSQERLKSEVCTQLAYMIPLRVENQAWTLKIHSIHFMTSTRVSSATNQKWFFFEATRLIDNTRYSQSSFLVNEIDIDKCLLAFLQSQSVATPDVVVGRRHKGSSKIRVEAFITHCVLVTKVGTTDQLAFFLPGVVSQIGKLTFLQDEANISSLDDSDIDLYMDKSTLSFLEELRHLKKQDHGQLVEKRSILESSQYDVKVLAHGTYKNWITTTSSNVDKLLYFLAELRQFNQLGLRCANSLDVPASKSSYWIGAAALLGFALLFNILSLWLSRIWKVTPGKPQAIISKEETVAAQGHGDRSNEIQHIKPTADANGAAKKGMVLPFTSLAMFGNEEHRRC